MKTNLKLFKGTALLTVLSFILVGCSGGESEGTTNPRSSLSSLPSTPTIPLPPSLPPTSDPEVTSVGNDLGGSGDEADEDILAALNDLKSGQAANLAA